jgi:cardiolipin synthase
MSIKSLIPGWFTVIVISRDVIILLGIAILSIMSIPYEIRPSFIGKVTTTLQLSMIFFSLVSRILPGSIDYVWLMILQWITILFTVASGLDYMFRGIKLNSKPA